MTSTLVMCKKFKLITQKGVLDKDKFYLPKNVVERFDGRNVWFKITKENAEIYRRLIFPHPTLFLKRKNELKFVFDLRSTLTFTI